MRKLLSVFSVIVLLCTLKSMATDVGGTISTNTTWTLANSPYVVTSSVTVNPSITLTIESGVTVKFNSNTELKVIGTLNASGTIFTSNQASPAPGDWTGFVVAGLSPTPTLSLSGCQILYAKDGINAISGTIDLPNTSILNSSEDGIYASNSYDNETTTITADNLTISGTGSNYNGIYARKTVLNLTNSSITNVGQFGIRLDGSRGTSETVQTDTSNVSTSTISDGDNAGIYLEGTAKIELSGSTISNNGYPINIYDGDLVISSPNTFTGNSTSVIYFNPTSINRDYTFYKATIPYYLRNVQSYGHLTIKPGTVIKFNYNGYLNVSAGKLTANGTVSEPITFTSYSDDNVIGDSNGNGSNDDAYANRWAGIYFENASDATSSIDYAVIKWAQSSSTGAGIVCRAASPSITNSTILNSYYGARFQGDSNPTFSNNTIGSSNITPVAMSFEADPVFSNNSFSTSDNEYDAIGLLGGEMTANANIVKRNFTDIPNVTYVLLETITVPVGISLSIEPGVVIKALSSQHMNVEGTLTATGALDAPVVFTSVNDDNHGNPNDTRNDGNTNIPSIGNFGGFYFGPNSDASVMDSVLVKFANYGGDFDPNVNSSQHYNSAIALNTSDVTIKDSRITDCNYAVTFRSSNATISNNELVNTVYAPFRMSLSSNPVFTGNTYLSVGWKGIAILNEKITYTATLDKRDVAGLVNTTYINQGLHIATGANVTINPGVIIKSTNGERIVVEGGLKVAGIEADPVIFTALADDNAGASIDPTENDTEGNGNSTDPNSTKWAGIMFLSNSDDAFSSVEHAEFWFGGKGTSFYESNDYVSLYAPISFNNAAAPVSNVTIKFSDYYGLYFSNNSTPLIDNVFIQSSDNDPIAISFFANPTFTNMTFDANGSNGLRLIEDNLASDATVRKRDIAGIQNIAYILGSLSINSGATLTINPGVVLKLPGSQINVYDGAINAIGTPTEPIIFTSEKDDSRGGDTNNDGNGSVPAAGNWGGIDTYATSIQSHFQHCEFRYGGSAASYPETDYSIIGNHLISRNNGLLVEDCLIQLNSSGAFGSYGTSTATFRNNKIENICGSCTPVHMSMFANPTLEGNTVENIGYFAIGIKNETFTQNATFRFRSFAGVDSITYIIDRLGVASGTKITIPPGMVIKTHSYDILNIEGEIHVAGTAQDPVVFTTISDDEYGRPLDTENNGVNNSIGVSGYNYIVMKNISNDASLIENAIFRYKDVAIKLESAGPIIQNNLIEKGNYGINATGLSEPKLIGNRFKDLSRAPYITSLVAWPLQLEANLLEGTTWRGIMIQNETLTQDTTLIRRTFAGMANVPYIFNQYTVGTGVKLSVDPGLILKFYGEYSSRGSLDIKGALHAVGGPDADSTIIFTDYRDDFYGGFSGQNTGYGWNGISFQNESSDSESILKHTVIKRSDNNGLTLNSASPTIENVSFQENNNWGLSLTGASNPTINSCDFLDNGGTYYGAMSNTGSFEVNATNCWWGSNSGPYHATLNLDGTGNKIEGAVIFDPWATDNSLNPKTGDISLNGNVTAYDAALGLQAVAGLLALNERQNFAADVSGNDLVGAMDASYILQFSAGIIAHFPAEAENKRIQESWVSTHSDIIASLGDASIEEVNQMVEIPLTIGNVKDLYAFEAAIHLDEELEFVEFRQTGWKHISPVTNFIADRNELRITFASVEATSSDAEFGVLVLKAKSKVSKTQLPVSISKVVGNDTNVTLKAESGFVNVAGRVLSVGNMPSINVYPNPATEYIEVTLPNSKETFTLSLHDLNGKTILQNKVRGKSTHTFNLNKLGLKNGLYLLKVGSSDGEVEHKIMITQ